MKISRTKFIILFLAFAFLFQFISNSILGPDVRLFPKYGSSFLETQQQAGWKGVVSTLTLPVRAVLIYPLLPYVEFLRQEPDTPPPFFAIGFLIYWSLLALVIHYLYSVLVKNRYR